MDTRGCSGGGVDSAFEANKTTAIRALQQQLELLHKQKISNLEAENAKLFQLNSQLNDEFQKMQQHYERQSSKHSTSSHESLADISATLITNRNEMETVLKAISDKIDAQSREMENRLEKIENVLSTLELPTLSPTHSNFGTDNQNHVAHGKSTATSVSSDNDALPEKFENVSNTTNMSTFSSGSPLNDLNDAPEVTFSIIRIDSLQNTENASQNNGTQELSADSRDPSGDVSDLLTDTQPITVGSSKKQPRRRLCQTNKASDPKGMAARRRTTSDTKIHECDYCDKRFRTKAQLACHLRVHTGEMPYRCNVCGKKFPYASSLLHHNRTHNANRERFKCDICGKSSTTKSSLQAHKRTHQAVKDIKCMFCEKSFSTNGLMFDHIRRRHIFEKSIECAKCEMCFLHAFAFELSYT